ncbi:MAG: phosphate regulon sensor histidine kinase PhoR [Pseudomonadota bacterium]|nr:PAS domain-containing sensor histidine kinase [Pseudomonadales bacterium]MDY6920236.1 phosphate regulon sensor histidine kinase PhoR [Pseudomonadota bacterium]
MREWTIELNQFILLLIIGAAGGWVLGYPGVGVALVSVPYGFWMLFRTRDLARWLIRSQRDVDPPESSGIWGQIFDALYQQKKDFRREVNDLQGIIQRARQSTNAIRDAVVVVDRRGNLEWWNEAGNQLLGFRQQTDQGHSLTNLLRDPRFIGYFEAGEYERPLEIASTRQPGVILQFQITRFGEGERLLVVRDITRLHNLEQMRQDFVANVSHELRTPLTVIKGYLETFMDSVQQDHPQLRRGLERMNEQASRMEALVTDLLLLSRLETENHSREVRPVGVPKLLRQIQGDALAMNDAKQHNIVLEADPELDIYGDEKELRSAFSNLVMNAVKYSPAGSTITIRWYQDDKGIYMEVEDDGDGIDPQHLPRLTERFYRADQSRHSKTGGTGLGLAIVKHVLIHHGAKLNIYSQLGEGSVFTCHFPRNSRQSKDQKSVA